VLIAVQVLILFHILHWLWTGETLTPVEPSEAMHTARSGVVNAGAVFLVAALLATLVLGRWFCGWGCHVLLLQDGCAWIMKKMGIRPRAFRSRFLIYVPFSMAFYMFLWPFVERFVWRPLIGRETDWPGFTTHFMTSDFWHTFPGVMVAIPFLFLCGFAAVYFLGAKGFCTYGCPYGGLFAPADKLSPLRIRVTPDCEGCSHCTAVCTSNVRVHEEVREYGMVVDSGCMKCMDCVSVCPKDALFVGWGKPALLKGPAKNKEPKKNYDLTLGEEFFFALFFVAAFLSVHFVYTLIPFLMAGGWAGALTFCTWKAWRILKERNISLYGWRLRLRGQLRPSGATFLLLTGLFVLLTLHCGTVNALYYVGRWHDQKIAIPAQVVFSRLEQQLPEPLAARVEKAIHYYEHSAAMTQGGLGLLGNPSVDYRLGKLYCIRRDFGGAEQVFSRLLASGHTSDALLLDLARVQRNLGNTEQAIVHYEAALAEYPEQGGTRRELADYYVLEKRYQKAARLYEDVLAQHPDRVEFRYRLGRIEARHLDAARGSQRLLAILQDRPRHVGALTELARLKGRSNNLQDALNYAERGYQAKPNDLELLEVYASLLQRSGKGRRAQQLRLEARHLRQQ
jgi:tetratricopeptide (TPR) repeat protein/ferredoxin